jgi:predicted YcjX-like family ATPase
MTKPDYRALCEELLTDYEQNRFRVELAAEARAALAQPEPVAPTDEELLQEMPQQFRDDLATVSRLAAHGISPDVTPGLFRVSLNTGALAFARAVLARWGTPAINTREEIFNG